MKIADLSPAQRKVWIAARRYAAAEIDHANEHYSARSTGDYSNMQHAEKRRTRAARTLLRAVINYID